MSEYPLVSIEEIAPGAVTATEVRSSQGRFLFPEGITLSGRDIQKCKAWGVWNLKLKTNPAESVSKPQYTKEEVKKVKDNLFPFFAFWDFKNEVNKELFKNIVLWTTRFRTFFPEYPMQAEIGIDSLPGVESKPDLEQVIRNDENLATLPDIFSKLMTAVRDPKCTSHYLAKILGNDPALCAKVLKLVNSPVYGLMRKIENMERAVTLVGINEISKIALSISVISMFKDIPGDLMNMRKFWGHCIGCGIVAEIIAEEKNIPSDRFLVAGMLHDIGRLIMLKNHPRATLFVIDQARKQKVPLYFMEKEIWGFDHCQVGQKILRLWSLPEFLVQAALCHHDHKESDYPREMAIIRLADSLVQAMFMGYSGNQFIPLIPVRIWEELEISPRIIAGVFTQTQYRAEEMISTLL
ncbi:MAG: HDOD domain-containing protein [Thermodesulfobacteriota bacterium]